MSKLRELALAATRGEWELKSTRTETGVYSSYGNVREHITSYIGEADAAWVVATQPATVLRMLDVVEAARAFNDAAASDDRMPALIPHITALSKALAALRKETGE